MISRAESKNIHLPYCLSGLLIIGGSPFYDAPLPVKAADGPAAVESVNMYKAGN